VTLVSGRVFNLYTVHAPEQIEVPHEHQLFGKNSHPRSRCARQKAHRSDHGAPSALGKLHWAPLAQSHSRCTRRSCAVRWQVAQETPCSASGSRAAWCAPAPNAKRPAWLPCPCRVAPCDSTLTRLHFRNEHTRRADARFIRIGAPSKRPRVISPSASSGPRSLFWVPRGSLEHRFFKPFVFIRFGVTDISAPARPPTNSEKNAQRSKKSPVSPADPRWGPTPG
jgi:hypothetical protein